MNKLKQKVLIDKYSSGYRPTIIPEIRLLRQNIFTFLPGMKYGITLIWNDE